MRNKKAQIYTIMAIVLIGLLFVSIEVFSVVNQRHEVKTRVSTMESFLTSIEKNFERQVFISGFRIIFLAENEIATKGTYISNLDNFFEEAFFNGTVNGIEQEILLGATYDDILNSMNEKAKKVNVEITFKDPEISVSQEDPWRIMFKVTTNFTMEDISGLARWDKQQKITAYIPIEGFEDPIYIINTNGLVPRKINRTIYTEFIVGNDVSNLLDHLDKGYYLATNESPNFLDRLRGDSSPDANGIESLVNLPELSTQGIPTNDKTAVDHIYFSASNPSASGINGMPAWFNLDSKHLSIYTS